MEELPLGFGMALAQHPQAMEHFCAMPENRQKQIIAHTHSIQSKQEMHAFVQKLAGNTTSFS